MNYVTVMANGNNENPMGDDADRQREVLLARAARCAGRKRLAPTVTSLDEAHATVLEAIHVACEARDRANGRPLGTTEAFLTVQYRPDLPKMSFVQVVGMLRAVLEEDPISTWVGV